MPTGRVLIALWIVCTGVVAWVWLRPLHDGTLPGPRARTPHKARHVDPAGAPLAQPEDEPVADEPVAAPVSSGPPEMPSRQDLEGPMLKVSQHVLQSCRDVEQFTGLMTVRLVIARSGNVQSTQVQPPSAETRTAECVKHALHGLSFPRFRGTYAPTIEWTYPFLFEDRSAAHASEALPR
jgi:hypothetical protein